jgi:acyl-CoA thioester hydrolase
MTFRHTVKVRYGECDMQGVVFNAHYLAYADDAVMQWFLARLPADAMYVAGNTAATFDFMVKKAAVTWSAGSTVTDLIDLDCSVARWGKSSFDIHIAASSNGADRFQVGLTYVSVTPGTHQPCRVPAAVRAALDSTA